MQVLPRDTVGLQILGSQNPRSFARVTASSSLDEFTDLLIYVLLLFFIIICREFVTKVRPEKQL